MVMKMKELPMSERPYEKLEMYGEMALSNAELLAIILKNGTRKESSVTLAQKILSLKKEKGCKEDNLNFLQEITLEEFRKIPGIGKVKSIQLKAVCELAKRISRPIEQMKVKIKTPEDVANLLTNELKVEKREIVKIVLLNSQNSILKITNIAFGGTSSAIVNPKDILAEAIQAGAPKYILVHNHPSGDSTPSKQDLEFTVKMYQASQIIGIDMLDHIVIGHNEYKSIFEFMGTKNIETLKM